ncbi:hypothetical protein ATY41_02800 [Leifsonia xyli subsp. xyli]|uniref:Methyltransferase n=1 Tax=Leifsonia xyli subsp. xyli TaxID=59736 RepID=A0A1E2SJR4_LEIXY|nr:site-specific DNA-methyltransferase [Leifsonia xyli]ODA89987.1 hypothetical protein ATY41_02800 [Leifsonia xyli subsp. xyli]
MRTPYYQDDLVTLWHGDCLDVLRVLPKASVDAVVTDPPYNLSFMGNQWDGADGFRRSLNASDAGRDNVFGRVSRTSPEYRPPHTFQQWCAAWATEFLRVLRPGGHLLAFGGSRTWNRLASGVEDAGFEMRDSIAWLYGSGFPKSRNLHGEWEGWGTALKPAFEPVVVARKPLSGTVAATVLAHGTGALNIDATRVHTAGREAKAGRWPTNVILEESQAEALDEQTGILTSGLMKARTNRAPRPGGVIYGADKRNISAGDTYGDTGGASRFFPTFRYQAKAPTSQRPNAGGVRHPTVKPLDLMRWLVRLVTPPDGIVLDPFAGSGTTVEAALLEGFRCVAIEHEADYLPLITQRLTKPLQQTIFGDWDGAA